MLAAVLPRVEKMVPLTAVFLPVIRGPLTLARGLSATDNLAGGRLIAGLGAGSAEADFQVAGVPYAERWERFDESVQYLRSVWSDEVQPFRGRFYSSEGVALDPGPAQAGGPPIWIGAWGSPAGIRRTAQLGDGWIASAYNTSPPQFAAAWSGLRQELTRIGKDPGTFPNALATMALYVSEDVATVDRTIEALAGILHRDGAELRKSLLIGSPEACAERIREYDAAGLQRMLVMPVADEFDQLTLFRERVLPLLA